MQHDTAIYLDMDGVFTDFSKSAHRVFEHYEHLQGLYGEDVEHCEVRSKLRDEMIVAIRNTPDFWHTLEWEQNGKELYDFIIKNFAIENISMLTAPMSGDYQQCVEGKLHWFNTNLKEVRSIIIDDLKWNHVGKIKAKNQILVDDREKNIRKWREAGGYGILHHHTNLEHTLKELGQFI